MDREVFGLDILIIVSDSQAVTCLGPPLCSTAAHLWCRLAFRPGIINADTLAKSWALDRFCGSQTTFGILIKSKRALIQWNAVCAQRARRRERLQLEQIQEFSSVDLPLN